MALDNIENLSESGVPPKTRIKSADDARSILYNLISDDQIASYRRSQIQGIIDGNPPYSDQVLREKGQWERINVNWGHAEAKVENACLPYFDMLTSVPTYATIRTAYGKPDKRETNDRIISEEFHRLLSKSVGFLKQHQVCQKNIVIQGTGCLYFPDARDWRARSIDPWNVVVPKDAKVDWNQWEFCFILDEYYAEQLYRYIRNPEVARRNGWMTENTKQSIIEAQVDVQDQRRPWEWYQQQLKNNSLYYSYAKSKIIKIAHMYLREFDGKISHYVFDRLNDTGWLCKKIGRYKSFNHAFTIFLGSVGNGCYAGVRGLGQKVLKYGEAMNRMNNALVEGTIVQSALMLQPAQASDVSKLQSVQLGPYRILPPGLSFVPISNTVNLSNIMQVAAYFQGQESDQISSFIPSLNPALGKRTERETEMELGEKARLTTTRAEIYLTDLDVHYAEVYRRASNPNLVEEDPGGREALEFQSRCINRGVPKAALLKIESVKATRSIGMGSSAARMAALRQVAEFLPMLPENKRIKVINSNIAAAVGQAGLEVFGIDENEKPTGNDASIASLENNAFVGGGQVIVDPNQNHYIHCSIHLKFFGEVVQAVQKGQLDPREAYRMFSNGGPHLLMHLGLLQQDPTRKAQFEAFNKETADLMKIADQIAKKAEKQTEQEQEAQPEEDPMNTPEWAVANNRIRLDNLKAESDLGIKERKSEQQMMLKDETTAQKVTQSDIQFIQKQRDTNGKSEE